MHATHVRFWGVAGLVVSTSLAALAASAGAATFQVVDNPLAGPGGTTSFVGISDGRIVGNWNNANNDAHGAFLYSNGTFTPLNFSGVAVENVAGISGNFIVGGDTKGFALFDGTNRIDLQSHNPYGVDGGAVVGRYTTPPQGNGFVRTPDGSYTLFRYPGSTTTATGIEAGRIVGTYAKTATNNHHGFIYENNTFTALDYPGAGATDVHDIGGGRIVGEYSSDLYLSGSHGFVYDGTAWTTIDVPGAISTAVWDIDGSTIVGQFYDASGAEHAFISTVPEPAGLMFVGTAAALLVRRRRR